MLDKCDCPTFCPLHTTGAGPCYCGKVHHDTGGRIADLERQLAEKQAEIKAMRPVVKAAIEYFESQPYSDGLLCAAVRDYEARKQP